MRKCLTLAIMSGLLLIGIKSFGMDAKQRLAIIKGLKLRGIVGENNQGLLEFRGAKKAESVVNEENSQRRKTYQEIARKQGVGADDVGRQRAVQIAKEAPAGTWLQNADGQWYRKK